MNNRRLMGFCLFVRWSQCTYWFRFESTRLDSTWFDWQIILYESIVFFSLAIYHTINVVMQTMRYKGEFYICKKPVRCWAQPDKFGSQIRIYHFIKMKLIVLLSVIAIASCTVPSVFLNPNATGKKNCFCKEKECTDVSCEEKNCLCLVVRG